MTSPDNVPYADPEPLSEVIEECRCVQAECAAHGLDHDHVPHVDVHAHTVPPVISEATQHMVDGYSDYGA